jgi:hypothetical protein
VRAFPAWHLTDEIIVPIILASRFEIGDQHLLTDTMNTRDEYLYLAGLAESGTVTLYQEGPNTTQVRVSKVELQPSGWFMGTDGSYLFYEGILLVRLLTL